MDHIEGEPAIIVHNEITGEVLIFKSDTKQLWTPSHLKPKQMLRYSMYVRLIYYYTAYEFILLVWNIY